MVDKTHPKYSSTIEAEQRKLKAAGFFKGEVDGVDGPQTQGARDAAREASEGDAQVRADKLREEELALKRLEMEEGARRRAAEDAERQKREEGADPFGQMAAPFGIGLVGGGLYGELANRGLNTFEKGNVKALNEIADELGPTSKLTNSQMNRSRAVGAASAAEKFSPSSPWRKTAAGIGRAAAYGIPAGFVFNEWNRYDELAKDESLPYEERQAARQIANGILGTGTGIGVEGGRRFFFPHREEGAGKSMMRIETARDYAKRMDELDARPKPERQPRQAAASRGPLKTIDAEVISEPQQSKALPPPAKAETPPLQSKRQHSDRLISAAKAGGGSGISKKPQAADWLLAEGNINDSNRAAIAKELGVKPGPKFMERIGTAVKNMAKRPGASAIIGALTAYALSPDEAKASTGQDVKPSPRDNLYSGSPEDDFAYGQGTPSGGLNEEALTTAGIVGGLGYGMNRLIPRGTGSLIGGAMGPVAAMTGPDFTPETEKFAANAAVRDMPWLRHVLPGRQEAYDMAQVPEKNPARVYENAFSPGGSDRSIEEALNVVRRANGGRVSGGIEYAGGGRTDNVPMDVEPSSYVVPADVVSALGQGNTMAGVKVLDNMFPPPMEAPGASQPQAKANGGRIPIIAAGGEFLISPYHVAAVGEGDVEKGADILDAFIQDVRQQHISTLSALPGPAQ